MSWEAVAYVLRGEDGSAVDIDMGRVSEARRRKVGADRVRLVLLCIAEYANAEGVNAYPSYDKIAQEVGFDKSVVLHAVLALEELGIIVNTEPAIPGRRGKTYALPGVGGGATTVQGGASTINQGGAQGGGQGGAQGGAQGGGQGGGVGGGATTRSGACPSPDPKTTSPLSIALTELFGAPATPSEHKQREMTIEELEAVGATSDGIAERKDNWYGYFDYTYRLTERALCLQWSTLSDEAVERERDIRRVGV